MKMNPAVARKTLPSVPDRTGPTYQTGYIPPAPGPGITNKVQPHAPKPGTNPSCTT